MAPFMNVVGVFVAVCIVILTYFKWTYQYWKRKNIPYFEPKIPTGNLPSSNKAFPDHVSDIYKAAKEKGWKCCGLFFVTSKSLMILDLDLLKLIMTKDFKHFMDRGTFTNEKGEPITLNLATADGQKWRALRPKLSPTFTTGKLRNMFQTIIDSGFKLESYISEYVDKKEPIEIKVALERFGMDVIGSCAFGIECNTFTDPESPFVIHAMRQMNRTYWDNTKIGFSRRFPNIFKLTGLKVVDKNVTNFFTKLVNDTISYRKNNNVQRNDFMQLLIEMQNDDKTQKVPNKLTTDEIIAQSFLFFNAGFQTTSFTVTLTLFELCQNLEVQKKLREEVKMILQKHNNKVTYDSLSDMSYMEKVIKESLRIHNPVPINGRACNEDYRIPDTDIVIEKGTSILIPTIAIHMDEQYYPNPDKFDPERFNEENSIKRHQYAFIPFGEGPRICIGARFAMMEAKVALALILRKYTVKLNKNTILPLERVVTFGAVTRLKQKIWLDLEEDLS